MPVESTTPDKSSHLESLKTLLAASTSEATENLPPEARFLLRMDAWAMLRMRALAVAIRLDGWKFDQAVTALNTVRPTGSGDFLVCYKQIAGRTFEGMLVGEARRAWVASLALEQVQRRFEMGASGMDDPYLEACSVVIKKLLENYTEVLGVPDLRRSANRRAPSRTIDPLSARPAGGARVEQRPTQTLERTLSHALQHAVPMKRTRRPSLEQLQGWADLFDESAEDAA
jgi:hypothetical protein